MTRSGRLGVLGGTLASIVVAALAVSVVPPAEAAKADGDAGAKLERGVFHDAMRKLWEDHIVWTRQYIVSAATLEGDLPDIGPTTDRLLANQAQIGDALRPFYGDDAGDAMTALLRDHILGAAALISAAKVGDETATAAASTAWYANADAIATALSGLNPDAWDVAHMQAMMRAHLDRTLDEAVARLEGRYADDIAAYEAVHVDILAMADMLSDGIIDQFPDRFRR
jgi:hypothetical protein